MSIPPQWTPKTWDMGLGRFRLVFLLFLVLGLEDGLVPTSGKHGVYPCSPSTQRQTPKSRVNMDPKPLKRAHKATLLGSRYQRQIEPSTTDLITTVHISGKP